MYAVDSVLVNAGMLRNSVTVTGPSVADGAAASASVELGDALEEAEAAAAPVDAAEVEEEDVEEVAAIQKDGLLASCRRA